ncbi:lipase domain-containing protein [Phthorimaea operculella]|nr:lipase domain-containing protein [Phthorimaea operculella]
MVSFVTYLVLLCGISTCQAAVLTYFEEGGQNISATLGNCPVLLNYLNDSRITIIITHGEGGQVDGRYITNMVNAYILTHNVMLLDWTEEAQVLFGIAFLSYVVSNAPSAEKIGYDFGACLCALVKAGLGEYFLVGHSLGAHLMGAAGRHSKQLGCEVGRIIGLDPSKNGLFIVTALDFTCAIYVFCLHTDPNGYGDPKAVCTVDVYPNYAVYTIQPGCTEKANFVTINENTTCSHDYSWRLIIASRSYSNLLIAQGAASGPAWQCGRGNGKVAYITVEVQPGVSGKFYLRTNATYPYALGEPGKYSNATCPLII